MKRFFVLLVSCSIAALAADEPQRIYQNQLKRLKHPVPLLADHPEFVEPIVELTRYEAPAIATLQAHPSGK